MTPPPIAAGVEALSDVQILLRLRALKRQMPELKSEIEAAETGLFSRRPDWLLKAKQEMAQLVEAYNQVRDEGAARVMARREARAPAGA